MRWPLAAMFVFVATSALPATVPQFASFPPGAIYRGRSARPVLTDPSAYSFRTRIIDSTKQPVNFAGHYHLTAWGCGTTCSTGAVTDAITGRVTMLLFSICCYSGPVDEAFASIIGKPTSRLIVFSGQRNEEGLNGTHFYEFDGREFRFIMSKPAPREPSQEPDQVKNREASAFDKSNPGDETGNRPQLGREAPYEQARATLIQQGWSPVPSSDASNRGCMMSRSNMCKPDWPEVEDCSGTGLGYCLTRWKRGHDQVTIQTAGDYNVVDVVMCR